MLSRDGSPCLLDFALATSLAEMRPEFTHHAEIAGTLAYLAPEQTGRSGRPVDQRADLYALGAVLYELATGAPPFGAGDPLQLIHDHLARVPAPPADVHPSVPAPLSGIIVHLLEKGPDNRYQTAEGVIYDLERSRDARTHPERSGLRVGEHDVPLRLLPPSRLVGRDGEAAALGAAFEEALETRCREGGRHDSRRSLTRQHPFIGGMSIFGRSRKESCHSGHAEPLMMSTKSARVKPGMK